MHYPRPLQLPRNSIAVMKAAVIKNATAVVIWALSLAQVLLKPLSRAYQNHETPETDQPITKRPLVILMGNLRGGEEAWKSLYKNVLDQNGTSVDLALMIMDDYNSTYPNSSLLERAKYIWTFPSYDNWIDAVDEVNGTSWRETHLPTFKDLAATNGPSILFGPLRVFDEEKNKTVQFAGSAMLIFMIRWFLIQKIHEQGILEKYDRFVVTRTDHFYACHHSFMSLDLSDGRIWLPVGQDFGGYTDRHMVVGGENLIDALDLMTDMILKPFDPSPHLAEAKAGRFGPHHNSESFLKHVWDSRNLTVSRLPRVMYVCAVASDTSHFKIAKIPSEHAPGLLAKYQKEYDAARQCSNEMRPDPLEFCGHCQWQRSTFDCEMRIKHVGNTYHVSREEAIRGELTKGHCLHEKSL